LTAGGGFVRIPVTHDSVDHTWMVRTIESLQHDLIKRYDVVLVTDVDEIVAPEPDWGSLGDYIDRFDEEFVNCLGYELLHVRDVEGPFRADRPVLEQRGHWFANDGYDKPLISTVPMEWTPGFHTRSDGRFVLDPDLRLIHLHRMDYDVCLQRHRWRRSRGWNQRDVSAGWAQHNRITEEKEFERWFYTDSCFEVQGIHIALERIPPPGAACSRRTPEVGASAGASDAEDRLSRSEPGRTPPLSGSALGRRAMAARGDERSGLGIGPSREDPGEPDLASQPAERGALAARSRRPCRTVRASGRASLSAPERVARPSSR
jgi:hypothetical protein